MEQRLHTEAVAMPQRRYRFGDAMVSAVSVLVLIVGLAAIDNDIRGYIFNAINGDPSALLPMLGLHADAFAAPMFRAVSAYWSAHTPLVVFGLASVTLVGFILRL